jgi:bifunctional non-homologous end joining protein LigD
VRLFTGRGHDWTGRYPAIASAAAKIRAQSFTLDGEAVVRAKDGAIFDALHRHSTVRAAILQTFDLLELNGEDLRPLMLGKRKARLVKFLARAPPGIESNAHTDEDGAPVFRHACVMGLEGTVSKRLTAPYGRCLGRRWTAATQKAIATAGPGLGLRSLHTCWNTVASMNVVISSRLI